MQNNVDPVVDLEDLLYDSFYCRPTKRNCITKLSLATEELYLYDRAKALTSA